MKATRPRHAALSAAGIVLGGALLATTGFPAAAPPTTARYDLVYSTEVVTPHVPWATKIPGGPVKGFFMPSVSRGRDMVELMQRLALEPRTVTVDRQWDVNCWGIGDYYGHEYRGDRDDFRTVLGYVEEELTSARPFEVLLIPGLNGWSRLTRPARDAILRRVEEGAGLVLLHPFVGDVTGHPFAGDEAEGDARIWDVSPLVGVPDDFVSERGYPELNTAAIRRGRWERGVPHFITEGIPLELIPSGSAGGGFYEYEPRGDVLIQAGGHPVLATKSYGKGRVVAFAYVEDGFLPESVDPVESDVYWDYWEYQYGLLARSLLWAARRDGPLVLSAPRLTGQGGDGLELDIRSGRAAEVEIEVSARSVLGGPLGAHRERVSVPAGGTKVDVPSTRFRSSGTWPGGRQIVDVIVRESASGETLDWGTATFEAPGRATVTAIRPNAEVYRDGETMSIVTRAAGDLEGLKMRLEVRDDLGRLLHVEEKATPGERYFFYRLEDFVGKRALLTASLVEGGRVVDQLRGKPVVVVQRERRRKEYRGLLSFEDPPHFLAALRERRLLSLAMDGGFTWGGDVNDSLEMPRGWFGVYWYDRGPTTPEALDRAVREYERTGDFGSLQYLTKKELYRRTGDTRFLIRSPSLDDPAVLRTLADVGRAAARRKAVYNMDYYFVGDEGSLTSYADPVDFDFGPHALAAFRKWLREEYDSLEALNRTWRTRFESWDAVMPATTEEARQTGVFPPWVDHRRYMEISFARAYQVVRDAVREGDPEGRIALSGTQVTTPWNGADWSRLDQVIDDFLSYDGGNQWELHRSFAKAGARVGFWTGYGRKGIGVRHEVWSAALQGVLFPNLFWSYSIVNPDLTFSRSGQDLGTAFQELRFSGIGKLLMEAEREGDGIAVHYSMPSVHVAGILGLHDRPKEERTLATFPADRDGWVRALTDLGLSFDFVSSEQVEAGTLDLSRFKVFVMPLSLAVSEREASAVEAFARSGGVVIADAAAGLADEHGARGPSGRLDTLFGIGTPSPESRDLRPARPEGAVSVTTEGRSWELDASALQGLQAFEAGLEAHGGEALLRIGGAPAAFARPVGRGWALYLNALMDGYPELRKAGYGGSAVRGLLSALLERLEVRPSVVVRDARGQAVGPLRVARYRFGDSDVVGLLLEPVDLDAAHGRDGVTVYDDTRLGRVAAREVEVHLPRAGNVVDTRTGRLLARSDRVRTSLVAGEALVLAVSQERPVPGVRGPSTAAPGDHVGFSVSSEAPSRRLVRCHVHGPDGKRVPWYERNLLVEGGEASLVVPTALDDPTGRYRIQVEDVLAGTAAETALEVR